MSTDRTAIAHTSSLIRHEIGLLRQTGKIDKIGIKTLSVAIGVPYLRRVLPAVTQMHEAGELKLSHNCIIINP